MASESIAHSGSRNYCYIFRWRQKSKTSSTECGSRKIHPCCLFGVCSSRRESLTTLTPFFLAKSSSLLPFFVLSCTFIFVPNVSYICTCQQRRVYHCMNRCVTTIFSAKLLPPDRILKPALPSDSLSYSRALIASSLVLNEVIMSSTYTCNRIMAIASGWSFLLSSACCRTTYWAR